MLRLLCVQLSCGDREGQLSNINFIKSLVTVSTVQYSAVQYSTVQVYTVYSLAS